MLLWRTRADGFVIEGDDDTAVLPALAATLQQTAEQLQLQLQQPGNATDSAAQLLWIASQSHCTACLLKLHLDVLQEAACTLLQQQQQQQQQVAPCMIHILAALVRMSQWGPLPWQEWLIGNAAPAHHGPDDQAEGLLLPGYVGFLMRWLNGYSLDHAAAAAAAGGGPVVEGPVLPEAVTAAAEAALPQAAALLLSILQLLSNSSSSNPWLLAAAQYAVRPVVRYLGHGSPSRLLQAALLQLQPQDLQILLLQLLHDCPEHQWTSDAPKKEYFGPSADYDMCSTWPMLVKAAPVSVQQSLAAAMLQDLSSNSSCSSSGGGSSGSSSRAFPHDNRSAEMLLSLVRTNDAVASWLTEEQHFQQLLHLSQNSNSHASSDVLCIIHALATRQQQVLPLAVQTAAQDNTPPKWLQQQLQLAMQPDGGSRAASNIRDVVKQRPEMLLPYAQQFVEAVAAATSQQQQQQQQRQQQQQQQRGLSSGHMFALDMLCQLVQHNQQAVAQHCCQLPPFLQLWLLGTAAAPAAAAAAAAAADADAELPALFLHSLLCSDYYRSSVLRHVAAMAPMDLLKLALQPDRSSSSSSCSSGRGSSGVGVGSKLLRGLCRDMRDSCGMFWVRLATAATATASEASNQLLQQLITDLLLLMNTTGSTAAGSSSNGCSRVAAGATNAFGVFGRKMLRDGPGAPDPSVIKLPSILAHNNNYQLLLQACLQQAGASYYDQQSVLEVFVSLWGNQQAAAAPQMAAAVQQLLEAVLQDGSNAAALLLQQLACHKCGNQRLEDMLIEHTNALVAAAAAAAAEPDGSSNSSSSSSRSQVPAAASAALSGGWTEWGRGIAAIAQSEHFLTLLHVMTIGQGFGGDSSNRGSSNVSSNGIFHSPTRVDTSTAVTVTEAAAVTAVAAASSAAEVGDAAKEAAGIVQAVATYSAEGLGKLGTGDCVEKLLLAAIAAAAAAEAAVHSDTFNSCDKERYFGMHWSLHKDDAESVERERRSRRQAPLVEIIAAVFGSLQVVMQSGAEGAAAVVQHASLLLLLWQQLLQKQLYNKYEEAGECIVQLLSTTQGLEQLAGDQGFVGGLIDALKVDDGELVTKSLSLVAHTEPGCQLLLQHQQLFDGLFRALSGCYPESALFVLRALEPVVSAACCATAAAVGGNASVQLVLYASVLPATHTAV